MNQGIQVVQSKTTLLILYIVHALIYRGYSLLLLCGTLTCFVKYDLFCQTDKYFFPIILLFALLF